MPNKTNKTDVLDEYKDRYTNKEKKQTKNNENKKHYQSTVIVEMNKRKKYKR